MRGEKVLEECREKRLLLKKVNVKEIVWWGRKQEGVEGWGDAQRGPGLGKIH